MSATRLKCFNCKALVVPGPPDCPECGAPLAGAPRVEVRESTTVTPLLRPASIATFGNQISKFLTAAWWNGLAPILGGVMLLGVAREMTRLALQDHESWVGSLVAFFLFWVAGMAAKMTYEVGRISTREAHEQAIARMAQMFAEEHSRHLPPVPSVDSF